MKHVLVRYVVKPERASENERFIEALFDELARAQPPGIRYASFKLPGGVEFMHLATIDTQDGTNPLLALVTFQQFTAAIKDRCVEPPTTIVLDQLGTFPAH